MDKYALRREVLVLIVAFYAMLIFGALALHAPRCLEKPHSGISIGGLIHIAGCQ